jgi:hypothetical protein
MLWKLEMLPSPDGRLEVTCSAESITYIHTYIRARAHTHTRARVRALYSVDP